MRGAQMSLGFSRWLLAVKLMRAEDAIAAEAAARQAEASRVGELQHALTTTTGELHLSRRMMQKPTQLEREIADVSAERDKVREAPHAVAHMWRRAPSRERMLPRS